MTLPSSTRYDSKKDSIFAVLLWSTVFVSGAASVFAGLEDLSALLISGSLTLLLALLMGWIWFGTYYEFVGDFLVSHTGPFKESLRLDRILSVRATSNMLSSAALSRNRLEIRYGTKAYQITLVSPLDHEGFLVDLRLRCPGADLTKAV